MCCTKSVTERKMPRRSIAFTNEEIEEIWRLVPVGTPVTIRPEREAASHERGRFRGFGEHPPVISMQR